MIELFGAVPRTNGWTEQEKAELYRAASLLGSRGLPFDSEFGTTDDGDPWFLFIGRGTGEVLAHFARIDGTFVVHHAAADVVFESRDIRDLVDRVLVVPDRSVGRASGDAFHTHLAVTAAALGLSLEALGTFLDGYDATVQPAEAPAEAAPAADSMAAWLVSDEPAEPSAEAETIVGGDGPTDPDAIEEPQPQLGVVEVDAGDDQPADTIATTGDTVVSGDAFDGEIEPATDTDGFIPVPRSFDGVVLEGGSANDTLVGTAGADFIVGGDGHDLILAGAGDDVVIAGRGDDTVLGGDGDDVLAGGDGDDQLHGGQGDDLLLGGAGNDLLHGGKGNDTLQGFAGQDTLSGDGGDDLLLASSGDAVMIGGDGTNVFHFATGQAVAYGGADRDIFVYEEGERSNVVIHDFDPEQDELYYLDPSGRREAIDLALGLVAGELVINPELGGKLTILFEETDALLT